MKVRMTQQVSGPRADGREWPPVGGVIDVTPEEARDLTHTAAGNSTPIAVPVVEERAVETADAPEDPKVEVRAEPKAKAPAKAKAEAKAEADPPPPPKPEMPDYLKRAGG